MGTEIVCHRSGPHWLRDAEVIEDELPTFDEIILSNDSSDHKSCNSIIAIAKKVILNISSEYQISFGIFGLLVNTNQ